MSGRSKRKGDRIEREIVQLHREAGIHATRVPRSGALGYLIDHSDVLDGDVKVLPAGEMTAEVKARGRRASSRSRSGSARTIYSSSGGTSAGRWS